MAIVKTTPRETGSGPDNGETSEPVRPIDRTKSVVNQGGSPAVRAPRTPGMINRPVPQVSQEAGPKDFVNDTIAELKRVTWPTKEERAAGTMVTILLLVFFALYIAGLDRLVQYVFQLVGILPK
jgi:preprotein translocase subunit SecE